MKPKILLLTGVALCSLFTADNPASAQGTAFTYQGRLNDGADAANGTYDLTFALFNAGSGPSQVGSTITNTGIGLSNGLFTVALDFGANFPGADRWLEIGVRTNGGSGFTALSPRQQLTPAPYAVFANTASNLLGTLPTLQLTGTVGNGQLANSGITVSAGTGLGGGGAVALGGSTTLNNAGVLSVTGNSEITATTVGGAVTLSDTATSSNSVNTLVKRDGGGSFVATSLTLANNLYLPTPSAGGGIIYAGPYTLLQASGENSFCGLGAGNLTMSGGGNTAIGFDAFSSNLNGLGNTASGAYALYSNTNAYYNTAVGGSALYKNTSGGGNTAIGYSALFFNGTGNNNIAVGNSALNNNLTGNNNVANGYSALYYVSTGSGNIGLGQGALQNLTTGSTNIAIGVYSGIAIYTGNNNIDIGNSGFGDESGVIRIGTAGTHTKAVFNGIFGTTVGSGATVQVNANGLLGTVTSSRRFKQNIQSMADASDVLLGLHPVTFQYKPDLDPEATPQFGLIAEEVEKVDPALVLHDDKHQIYTVRYEAINAMLLNEFLKEHQKVGEQNAEIQDLKQSLAELKKMVLQLAHAKAQ
jgi:trimeric autotransporter adhesin